MATHSSPTFLCCAHAAGRGDLVRLLNLDVPIPREHAAALLGFALVDQESEQERPSAGTSIPLDARVVDSAKGDTKTEAATPGAPSLWRAIGPDLHEPDPSERELPACLKNAISRTGEDLAARSHKTILPSPLAPVSRLAAGLRRLVTIETAGRRLDEPKLVRRLAHLRPLLRLPCKPRRGWTPRLQVYWDQAQALGTCWHDQEAVIRWLRRWRGPQGLEVVVVDDEGRARWHPHTKRGQAPQPTRPVRPADGGTTLLALSDLGFALGDLARQTIWEDVHRQATRKGAHGRAMVLCPRHRWDSRQVARWHGVDWERPRGRPAVVAHAASRRSKPCSYCSRPPSGSRQVFCAPCAD